MMLIKEKSLTFKNNAAFRSCVSKIKKKIYIYIYIIKWLDNAYRVVRETRRQKTNRFVDITLFFSYFQLLFITLFIYIEHPISRQCRRSKYCYVYVKFVRVEQKLFYKIRKFENCYREEVSASCK